MDGEPVWLVSGSLRDYRGEIVQTSRMKGAERVRVLDAMQEVLDGIGNADHERCFRMNATLCIHRALRDEEKATLSADWCARPAIHLAGGPVELLWSRGTQDKPSVRPCRKPFKRWLTATLWLPTDCGRCAPCMARHAIELRVALQIEQARRQG
jgi:hypothetical protein